MPAMIKAPSAKARLTRQLARQGYRLGAPSHWTADAVAADVQVYRCRQCPRCRGRRMDVAHYHRPAADPMPASCKILVSCRRPDCGFAEEA